MAQDYPLNRNGNYLSTYSWEEYTQSPKEERWNELSEIADIFADETAEKIFIVNYMSKKFKNNNPWHQGFTRASLTKSIEVPESELKILYSALKKGDFKVLSERELK